LHVLMARILIRTVSSYVCPEGFGFIPSSVYGQWLSVFAGIQQSVDVAVSQASYVPCTHILLSARRNYKTTRKLSHLTVAEQFILRVSSKLSL